MSLIDRWNEVVKPDDTVYYLGDFSLSKRYHPNYYLQELNGIKHGLKGNHDFNPTIGSGEWASFGGIAAEIKVDGVNITLCHYKMLLWPKMYTGGLHLYAHSHGKVKGGQRCLDVGVDCWNYYPVTLKQIQARLAESCKVADESAA